MNINELLNTTPVLGVDIVRDTVLQFVEEQNRAIMTVCLNVGVDPDALILTGQKNAELMEALRKTERQLSEALRQLMEVRTARWKGAGMGDYYCSTCQHLTGHRTKFCPECGAKMDEWEEVSEG